MISLRLLTEFALSPVMIYSDGISVVAERGGYKLIINESGQDINYSSGSLITSNKFNNSVIETGGFLVEKLK